MAKHTLTDLKLRYVHVPFEEVEWLLKSRENTDVLSSSWRFKTKRGVEVQERKEEWRFSNKMRNGGSVTKEGVKK